MNIEVGILKKPDPGTGKRVLKVDREGPGPGKPGIPVPGFIPVASKKPGKGTRKPGNGSRTRSDLYMNSCNGRVKRVFFDGIQNITQIYEQ